MTGTNDVCEIKGYDKFKSKKKLLIKKYLQLFNAAIGQIRDQSGSILEIKLHIDKSVLLVQVPSDICLYIK